MRHAISRSWVLALLVVASAFSAAPALAADVPTGLTASPRSDHLVKLDWSWPASPTYPDELDIRRDGAFLTTVPPSATTFSDVVSTAGSTHIYELVPVNNGVSEAAQSVSVTLRGDLPNKPTNVVASFAPNTNNLATVTWTRGASDADVNYTVTAQQVGGGPLNTRTVRYPNDGTAGSLTMDVFASYTSYVFKVSAVEDVNDPPGDPGGSVLADTSDTETSFDVISPTFGGSLSAERSALGTVTATWPAATDSGTGVASYVMCVDGTRCTPDVPAQPLESTQSASVNGVRNDNAIHAVTVVAKDFAGNLSTPIGIPLLMPLPAKPVIALTSGGNGCAPLIAHATSSDTPIVPTFQLYVDGSTTPTPLDTEITGAPYQQLSLTAQASSGADVSAMSTTVLARVFDPDGPGPDTTPGVHGTVDQAAGSVTLSWDPIYAAAGAPIMNYVVTIGTLPSFANGVGVPQSDHPSVTIAGGLEPSENYKALVAAADACGRTGPLSSFTFRLSDTSPPSAPVLNVPSTDGRSIHLSWAPSSDNVSVDDYLIYQIGKSDPIGRTPFTYFDITGLNDDFNGSYFVVATDTVGNRSGPSATRSATTKDITPPNPPGQIIPKFNSGGTVTLGWSPATDNIGVVGYQVVRNSVTVQNVTTTSFTDRNLKSGQYVYEVRAYDAADLLSTPRTYTADVAGAPNATAASRVKVDGKGTKLLRVGSKAGSRIVLSFTIPQTFDNARLQLNVLKSVPMVKSKGNAKARVRLKPKLRVSLPAGSGRTQAGKRLAERAARKGMITIPIGRQKAGTLRLIVTATGGVLTLSGGGPKAPTISAAS